MQFRTLWYIHLPFFLQIFSGMYLSRTLVVKTAWIVFHYTNYLLKVLLNTGLLFNAPVYGSRSTKQKFSYTVYKNDTFQVSLLPKHRSEQFYVCCTLSWLLTSGELKIQVLCEVMSFWLINTSNYQCFFQNTCSHLLLDTLSDTRRI